jgi:hypothetical protein
MRGFWDVQLLRIRVQELERKRAYFLLYVTKNMMRRADMWQEQYLH